MSYTSLLFFICFKKCYKENVFFFKVKSHYYNFMENNPFSKRFVFQYFNQILIFKLKFVSFFLKKKVKKVCTAWNLF
ncbi:hypothetical protein DOS84_08680 [Flavobacterium aquariorum]|uniref:Uncharacterized protein n=1 Tax=Flavobacterium aquariorum TaxID=2217670 RepID=A0A2W7TX96_9FLAO|nr:hypothetical protein DOS84_08680 [Flavobacterium aquariorum]